MNIVNAHTLTKARLLSLQPKGRCVRTGDSVNELFSFPATAMAASENELASANCQVKTGNPPNQGLKPRSVYASDCTTRQKVTRWRG